MLITLHISGCISIISLIEYRTLFYLTDFSNDINKTVMFPLLLFLISFLFCSRYSGHNSALYMLVTKDTMLGLWGMFLITDFSMLQYTKSGIGGGGCFLLSFHFHVSRLFLNILIFCISMLHTTHGRLVVKLLHSD